MLEQVGRRNFSFHARESVPLHVLSQPAPSFTDLTIDGHALNALAITIMHSSIPLT